MIKFKDVTKKFGDVTALERVSFEIGPKEFIFITGPSGAGKTTVAKLIIRDFLPSSGVVEIDGTDIVDLPKKQVPTLRKNIGMIFQDLKLLHDRTVFENVALTLRVLGKVEEEIEDEVEKVLKLVGLSDRADFFPAQLAGGELQRVCIARAVVGKPEIVFADEPTGNLDLNTAWQIVRLLKEVNELGKTVIMATHNFEIVNEMEERVIELDKGKLVSDKKKGKYHLK